MISFALRRSRLLEALGPTTAAVIVSTPVAIRNNDVEHDFRQDSDLHYLTGFDEPDSVVVFAPAAAPEDDAPPARYVMFVRPRDPERETWDGARAGVEGAREHFGADAAYPIGELAQRLPNLLAGHSAVVYRWGTPTFDERLFAAIQTARRTGGRTGRLSPTRIVDPIEVLHEHRLHKEGPEVEFMRRASAITDEAHRRAMAFAAPGRREYELEALLLETFRRCGSERPAYGSIVGSGPNATVLHYRKNDRTLLQGDLVLIDAGCEYEYYASDVTRTFPVSGRFTPPQRAIYELVLEVQLACIAMVKPGATQTEIHERAVELLTRGLVRLGVLHGEVETLIKDKAYKPYYMHKTGHWLGMDVHDVGAYLVPDGSAARARPLEAGMVITIEPGLYFGTSIPESTPAEFRGIGVRIEDDVLVTETGHENLTAAIPKTVEDVERACATT